MLIPATLPQPNLYEQETMVNAFLRHVEKMSVSQHTYANIYREPDDVFRIEVPCDCGCSKRFVRRVVGIQAAWFTVHILNEVTSRVLFLAKFSKGAEK